VKGRAANVRRRWGFTLIELLVVIAIVAVLAALIFSTVQSARRRGNATQSSSNIRALASANMTYLADNGRYVPADEKRNMRRWHGGRKSLNAKFDPTLGFLAPYLGKSQRVTICPVFREILKGEDSFEEGTGGYGYNAAYIGGLPGGKWNADGTRESALAAHVEQPNRTVMFTSTAYAREGGLQEYAFCEPPFWDHGEGPTGARPSPSVHFRFEGKALVGWCDGHATFESPTPRGAGVNPHGGEVEGKDLGWFGPEKDNGYWNPKYEPER
jgi:prepilin-type N-terminal cleavage/methylation domain-containing protein